ncbi:hypothetical protein D6C98_00025 [Aureobasidium pullulans]|nr:hypothetical protein D6C98_00025 [Aureobasidium pullulans]
MANHQIRVPSVTEDDLRRFYNKHFASLGSSNRHHGAILSAEVEIDDDGLGYYPDGVKRTLTDDQIAMFRHSEIQALLRERRRRRKNSDSEPGSGIPTGMAQSVGRDKLDTAEDIVRQRSTSTSDSQSTGKRKWQRFIDVSETNPEHLTHRRIARELDGQQTSSVDLAYGDEEPAVSVSTKRPKVSTTVSSSRKHIAYNDADEVQPTQPAQPLSEQIHNRQFLWPTLETSTSMNS